MKIRIESGQLRFINLRTRMPFRYGIATMTRMPQVFLILEVLVDGRLHRGIASDLLPPKWFTKVPDKPPREEVLEMRSVIRSALDTAVGLAGENPFEIWQELYRRQSGAATESGWPPLLAHFGTSLVERALLESVCRAQGRPLHELLAQDQVGFRPRALDPELPSDTLPLAPPLPRLMARHTVGLLDPLEADEIPAAGRLQDGLPQALTECIRTYGLKHFKLKINGQPEGDLERLRRIAEVLNREAGNDYAFSLDGNEQFPSFTAFRAFWDSMLSDNQTRDFLDHLLFVEQPLHRDHALAADTAGELADWIDRPPIIIDESDGEIASGARALELGYAGTSHKNCKGVFKGLLNHCRIAQAPQRYPGRKCLMSGEDLCNQGPVALLQDLAAAALMGIDSVERNGHHYCAGLSMLPAKVQSQVQDHHPDLYHPSGPGWPTLNIQNGAIEIASLNQAPFGVGFELDPDLFTPEAEWEPDIDD